MVTGGIRRAEKEISLHTHRGDWRHEEAFTNTHHGNTGVEGRITVSRRVNATIVVVAVQ